ncbi:hypothetical protein GCM10007049_03100 [Echinicola pacifica]|uniref:Uncharacterized protein n=1 Tax=Echinicola pacifica TaxID=346377 RepID=A0A918UJC2_9BACT|nr:hypothetical protein GCM10007049_03100 [Echinicola pacifica]
MDRCFLLNVQIEGNLYNSSKPMKSSGYLAFVKVEFIHEGKINFPEGKGTASIGIQNIDQVESG